MKIYGLFKAIDKMDPAGFISFLTEDASFKFGNAQEVSGRENIQNAVANFFSTLKGLSHRIVKVWEEADIIICEGLVTYTKLDGKKLTLPFADILEIQGGLIKNYRIYMDPSPLYNQ